MKAAAVALMLLLAFAPAAAAEPPANDARAAAQRLTLPANVQGTLVEATTEEVETQSVCAATDGSVWYRFTPPAEGDTIIELDAEGDLDAAIDVFERVRSQFSSVGCDLTDGDGDASLELTGLNSRREHLIRVGKAFGSDAAGFRLQVTVTGEEAEPPGRRLPARGVRDSVDRLGNPSDAYNRTLRSGTTYRLSLAAENCVTLAIFAPGTDSFDGGAERLLRCGGYGLYTPEQTGRYFFVAAAQRGRGVRPYRLRVGAARRDDTTPGVFIRNNAKVRGRVNGRLDSVDLYRFDVTRRSNLVLRATGGVALTLVKDSGKRVDRGSPILRTVTPGRYYAEVRGSGRYTLRRISRTITRSRVSFGRSTAPPGVSLPLTLTVAPGVEGRGVIRVERFDPIEGWQFLRRYRVSVSGGRGGVSFTPPSVGRYRARAQYLGTRLASPSESGTASLRVAGPLRE